MKNQKRKKFLEDVIPMFEELQSYKAIGTVKECREAVNKQKEMLTKSEELE